MTQQRKGAAAKAVLDQDKPFTFTHNGKLFKLPPAKDAMSRIDGGTWMDSQLSDNESDSIKLMLKVVKLSEDDIGPDAYAALRSKPVPEFSDIIANWFSTAGVSPGE